MIGEMSYSRICLDQISQRDKSGLALIFIVHQLTIIYAPHVMSLVSYICINMYIYIYMYHKSKIYLLFYIKVVNLHL